MRVRTALTSSVLPVVLATLLLSQFVSADTTCANGQRPATAADLAAMQAVGIPNPAVGECWNPSSPYLGQATAQAKQDLQGMSCGSGINIQDLDANFAVCADKFMQALRQASPGACIRSAYRNPQQQLAACISICGQSSCPGKCAAPGSSFHQRGLAIDVNYSIGNAQAWQIAANSTGGGVANPSGLHGSDPNHFQATNTSCSGAPVPPSGQTDYYPASYAAPMQTLPLTAPLSAAPMATPAQLSPNPFMTSPIAPQTSSAPTQACSPQYFCSGSTVYYRSDSCATSIFQQCQYGCSGTACTNAPNQQSSSTDLLSPSNPIVTPTPASTSTLSSLGNSLAGSIQQSLGSIASSSASISTIIPGTTTQQVAANPVVGQSTFTAQDFTTGTYQPPLISQILGSIRSILQAMLSILSPGH